MNCPPDCSLFAIHCSLHRALALAADHLEEVVLAPVHVGLDLFVDWADLLELVEQWIEALGADAVNEGDELLAVLPVVAVVLDDLLDGLRGAFRGDTRYAGAVLRAADVATAAEEDIEA